MCSVVGCESGCRRAPRFKLSEDPERRLEWVQFLLEVNGQRLKESCWTDITICSEHFEDDCLVKGTPVQLKPSAVPSLYIKSEPEELKPFQEPVVTTEAASHCDQLELCDSPSSCSDDSGLTSVAAQEGPVPSDNSEHDYVQMLQEVVNIDVIREKAALLQMREKYVVNENRLLQLFSLKCPSCGSEVKVEKFTYGMLLILKQQCLQCEYRNQWKSQANASVPEDEDLTGGVDVTPAIKQALSTDNSNSSVTGVADTDEESDPAVETEESSDVPSDDDWTPMDYLLLDTELDESDEDSDSYDDDPLNPKDSHLCPDCGKFFNKRKRHTCEHKIKPYSCNVCGKRCVNEVSLTAHSRVHEENYEYPCKCCNVTFKTKVDKINHEQTHLNEAKPYKCPDCSETFAKNKERRIHLEDHRGPQEYKCHICGIEFCGPLPLQRHLAVHTGEKPFKCPVCERGFNQASHLKSHMRLHTGERPYKCQHCDKRFNHNVSLKSHVQRCHASNPGRGRKKAKKNEAESDAVDAQENGNKKGEELDSAEEGEDGTEDMVQKERNGRTKRKRRSTGRPVGRPKRNAAGNLGPGEERQGRGSNTKTAKVKVRKLKRKHYSDEESEDELTKSSISFESGEEEEARGEKVTLRTRRSRGRKQI